MSSPVFIVGGSRTGSELIKKIILKYTTIDMASEMWLLCPRWLHKDFEATAAGCLGKTDSESIERLVHLMYSKRLFGSFWHQIENRISKGELKDALGQRASLELFDVFDVLLKLHARASEKVQLGAKFPVHYSKVDRLMEWYPDCKIILTIRDPRAVYSSQFKKHTKQERRRIVIERIRMEQFAHISMQFNGTYKSYAKYRNSKNFYLSKYEDVVKKPDESMRNLCNFLGVAYHADMAVPQVTQNTSFRDEKKQQVAPGFQVGAMTAWENQLGTMERKLFEVVNYSAMRKMGYLQ
jgi:hypothetical protein